MAGLFNIWAYFRSETFRFKYFIIFKSGNCVTTFALRFFSVTLNVNLELSNTYSMCHITFVSIGALNHFIDA